MDTNVRTFDHSLSKFKGAPGHTERARSNFEQLLSNNPSLGFKGDTRDVAPWLDRKTNLRESVVISGKVLEDKLLRNEDIWLLRNAICSHTWRLPEPEIALVWTAYCERTSATTGSKKSVVENSTQTLPLAGNIGRRILLTLRSPEVQANSGLIMGSVDEKLMDMLTKLNLQSGLSDIEVLCIRSIHANGHNYEELFCKMYLILMQSIICHRVAGSRMVGHTIELDIHPVNFTDIEHACSKSSCIINVEDMSASLINLIHRASLHWPSQALRFGDDTYDFTAALQMPASSVAFLTTRQAVLLQSTPIMLDPKNLWIRIAQCANILGAVEDMCKAFKVMRGLAYFSFSLDRMGLLDKHYFEAANDQFVIDITPSYGVNTLVRDHDKTSVIPTELMSSSATLLLEVVEANHCWNRMHSIIETLGLTNHGTRDNPSEIYSSLCRDLGFISGSDFSPLPALIFGTNKVIQGQHRLMHLIFNYAHMLRNRVLATVEQLPYLRVVSAFPIKIEGYCTAWSLHREIDINPAESVGVYASDNAYANEIASWMYAIGMFPEIPLGGACRLGKKGYSQLVSGRSALKCLKEGVYKLATVTVDVTNAIHFAGKHNKYMSTQFSPTHYLSSEGNGSRTGVEPTDTRQAALPLPRKQDPEIDTFCSAFGKESNMGKSELPDLHIPNVRVPDDLLDETSTARSGPMPVPRTVAAADKHLNVSDSKSRSSDGHTPDNDIKSQFDQHMII